VDFDLPEKDSQIDGYESYYKAVIEPNETDWVNRSFPFELSEEKVTEELKSCQ
jgi:hypothetical protein